MINTHEINSETSTYKKIAINMIKPLSLSLFLLSTGAQALESSLQLHKTDQEGSYGYTLAVGDSFSKQSPFNWQVSYNRVQDVSINWNNSDIDFSLDTIDLALSYRYRPKSYDKFINSLFIEFQAGAGVALTENKFEWPELQQEKYFSEQGDVNPFVSVALYKEFTKNTSMQLGVKYYPSYSEFDAITSLFIGINYRFGRQVGY
jgi:hypothetical protein